MKVPGLFGSWAIVLALALAGCGSTEKVTVTNRLVSQEQELRDLQRAFDAGVLSPEEYEQQRRKALAR